MKYHVTITSRLTETYGADVDANNETEAFKKVNEAITADPRNTRYIQALIIDGQNIDLCPKGILDEEITDITAEQVEAQG